MTDFLVSIIVPCYNEADNIAPLTTRIQETLTRYHYEIILINDGSTDGTEQIIEFVANTSKTIKYLNFSRNFGHQAAIKAGIDYANGDCIVTIDADLQKPPELIPKMIIQWQEGYEIVNAICKNTGQPSFFKRLTSKGFYMFLSVISDQKVTPHAADFRLFDKKIGDIISNMPEKNLYLRGLFSWMGFKQTTVSYTESKRIYGETKYSTKKMLQLASTGVTSSSIKPLRMALSIGVLFACFAFLYGIYAIVVMVLGQTVSGWTSIIASIVFLAGIQLMVLGVMGEYIGKLYIENKQRPHYLISKTNIKETNSQINNHKNERRAAMF